jgi:anti-sigma factor RsiW
MAEAVSETDLQSFVDGELEPVRRFEIAHYLASHPALAAQVMADIGSNQALKVLFGEARWPVAGKTVAAARKLERGLYIGQLMAWAARAAIVLLALGLVYFVHSKAGVFDIADEHSSQKAFVADAVHAYRTQLLLGHVTSLANAHGYDAEEVAQIRAATALNLPSILPGLQVTNVQIVPTHASAGIDAMIKTENNNQVALFAVRTDEDATIPLTVSKSATETTIYWQQGNLLYALTGAEDEPLLQQLAMNFAKETN